MLIDQILSNSTIAKAGVLSTDLRGRLSKAPKFVLRQDFALAADAFSNNIDNVNKVLALARLPYPECWFEVAQADRRLFSSAPLDPGDNRLARIGFLCTQLDQLGTWSAQLFWSFAATEIEPLTATRLAPSPSGFMLVVDPHGSDTTTACSFRDAGGVAPLYRRLSRMSDWVGEPGYLIATLALLNSRNAAETQPVEANNKRRRLLGKPLLFNYHLVCIPQRYQLCHQLAGETDPAQLRAHFVRGHFKLRRTGLFWWSAYQRGDPQLGFVHKDYLLTQPRAAA